jgi:preprotein translocase subunit YajC
MGSRERKRAARQKRKTRSAERRSAPELAEETVASAGSSNGADAVAAAPRTETSSERKDREAREALEPLREGERPTVVTVGAVICTILTVAAVAGYALWDVLRDEPRPQLFGVVAFVGLVGAMAYGLWRTRYWAVLGFQASLVLVIISNALGLIAALSVLQAVANLLLLVAAGALFWFMVKAWARIQMPTRLPRE